MNANIFFRSVLRRWYVLVAGLILTGVLVSVVGSHVSPTYTRSASQVLVPGTKSYPTGDNAYLYTGNLTQAASVLIEALDADKVDGPILSAYPGSTISVTTDAATSGPMISVQITAKTDADAAGVLQRVVAQIDPVLLSLQQQANVPTPALIKAIAVTSDTSSQVSQKSRYEVMAGAGIVGFVVSVLLSFVVDRIVVSIRLARARKRGAAAKKNVPVAGGQDGGESVVDGLKAPAKKPEPERKSTPKPATVSVAVQSAEHTMSDAKPAARRPNPRTAGRRPKVRQSASSDRARSDKPTES